MATVFTYGHLNLLHKSGDKLRARYPLSKSTLTIGRHSTCECRLVLETCSKFHAVITVQELEPHQAMILVKGVNGLSVNGVDLKKGDEHILEENDLLLICERPFRWEGAKHESIVVDSPVPEQRVKRRQSLIELALATFISPSKPASIPAVQSDVPVAFQDVEAEEEQASGSDAITWDEVDEVSSEATPVDCPATPSLSHRARTENIPSSATKAPSTPDNSSRCERRTSLRMTIIPESRKIDFLKEREEYLSSLRPSSPIASPTTTRSPAPSPATSPSPRSVDEIAHQDVPRTPTSEKKERRISSTSRRISQLLLQGSPLLKSPAGSVSGVEAEEDEEEDSESSEEEEEDVEEDEFEEENFQEEEEREYLVPVQSVDDEVLVSNEVASQFEDAPNDVLQAAIGVPLPDSPSPTSTPSSSTLSTPTRPRSSIGGGSNRRHSLREKVLIRSAIRKSLSSQNVRDDGTSPTVAVGGSARPDAEEVDVEEEEVVQEQGEETEHDEEEEERESESEEEEEELASKLPPLTPTKHRDSIELTHLRTISPSKMVSTPIQLTSHSKPEKEEHEEVSDEVEQAEQVPKAHPPSPLPTIIRFGTPTRVAVARAIAALPSTPVSAPVAVSTSARIDPSQVPLPTTPIGQWSYTPQKPSTPVNATLSTPTAVLRTPSTPIFSLEEEDDGFRSEMTSPVTHHRVMATPKSALRSTKTGRRKSLRGFLAPPPSSIKRKVAFNQQVFIQEIVDLRDKRCYYEEEKRRNSLDVAMAVPLPDSPEGERTSTRAGTPARKATRVLTSTPSSVVRKAIQEAHDLLSPPKPASARRVPATGSAPSSAFATPSKVASTPMRASRVFTPAASTSKGPNPENLITASTKASRQAEIRQLLESSPVYAGPRPRMPQSASAPSNLARLEAQMAAIRRRSVAGPSSKPRFNPTSMSKRTPSTAALASLTATPTPKTPTPAPTFSLRRTPAAALASMTPATTPAPASAPATPAIAESDGFSTPVLKFRPITHPRALPTPNLATGFKNLFAPTALPPKTPSFTGMRSLFQGPSIAAATPKMDGVQELFELPGSPSPSPSPIVTSPLPALVSSAPASPAPALAAPERQTASMPPQTVVIDAAVVANAAEPQVEEYSPAFVDVEPAPPAHAVETPEASAEVAEVAVEGDAEKVENAGEDAVPEQEAVATEIPAKRTVKGKAPAKPKRAARAKVVETAVTADENVDEVEEVVIPKRRGRPAKPAVAVDDATAPAPAPEARRGRRAAPKPEEDKAALASELAEDPAPAPVKKAAARRGKAKAPVDEAAEPVQKTLTRKRSTKALEFHEDNEPVPGLPIPNEASTSQRVLQESTSSTAEDAIPEPAPKSRAAKAKAVEMEVVEKENAPSKGRRAATKKAPAPVEVAVATRSLRTRR